MGEGAGRHRKRREGKAGDTLGVLPQLIMPAGHTVCTYTHTCRHAHEDLGRGFPALLCSLGSLDTPDALSDLWLLFTDLQEAVASNLESSHSTGGQAYL